MKLTAERIAEIIALDDASTRETRAMAMELRQLRALLATPMPCGWEVPLVDDDEENGGKLVRWGGDVYEDPDDALAIGAALIRAALEAKGEKP